MTHRLRNFNQKRVELSMLLDKLNLPKEQQEQIFVKAFEMSRALAADTGAFIKEFVFDKIDNVLKFD